MKRFLLAAVVALTLAAPGRDGHSQAVVYCSNCVSPVWQLPQWLQNFQNQSQMIQQQIQMVQYQINFWTTLVQNTIDLPQRIFSDITGEIYRLQSLVRQAELIGQRSSFMISHLGDSTGFGGDLSDIPRALAQENNALAYAAQIMGMAVRSSQDMQMVYAAQINTLQAQSPSGMTQAVQIGNRISATQAQQNAVYMNAQTVAMQTMATAELRRAHRETLLDARALQDQQNAVAQECGHLTVMHPPVCQSGTQSGLQVANNGS